MKYILFTYEVLVEFTSGRFYQVSDFDSGRMLLQLLETEDSSIWKSDRIRVSSNARGIILYTSDIDRKRGLIFDMETFCGFKMCPEDKRMMMLQRILKYAVRYFDKQQTAKCEKEISNTNLTIVFPYPFSANKNVDKVFIDRNSFKQDRKGKDFLTVFGFGVDERTQFSATNARKAVDDLEQLRSVVEEDTNKNAKAFLKITELEPFDLPIDGRMDYDSWMTYATNSQKAFITKSIVGPERLEGAAGTGKTISMILRCVHIMKQKIAAQQSYRIIFITHSLATKERIIEVFKNVWDDFENYQDIEDRYNSNSINITTLQEWCGDHIGAFTIHSDQFLDKDAADSKLLQRWYVAQAFDKVYSDTQASLQVLCSPEFNKFLLETSKEVISELFQQEIAVMIKGRAGQNLVKYKALQRPTYAIPLMNDADKDFVFAVYKEYRQALINQNRYDNDDIVLSALKNLDTPIWDRLRSNNGYDSCFIDETHLFNINELTIFQYLNKEETASHIVYAIDKSQAVGDWGIDENLITDAFGVSSELESDFSIMFRNSPEIVDLAFCILSHGASLFTNFENPLDHFEYGFTREQEQKCMSPQYYLYNSDEIMLNGLLSLLNEHCREKKFKKSGVLVAFTTDSLLYEAKKMSIDKHIPFECLTSRCDINTVNRATQNNKYVFAGIDYVGGLEFESVIIVGVDKGRVPPEGEENLESSHILSYAWHNRMYVAITRAKYAVTLLGNNVTGESPLLELAKMYTLINVEYK
jgi:superfamily I DNA/RNA helicase